MTKEKIAQSSTPATSKVLSKTITQFSLKILSNAVANDAAAIAVLNLVRKLFPYLEKPVRSIDYFSFPVINCFIMQSIGELCKKLLELPTLSIAPLTSAVYLSLLGLVEQNEKDKIVVSTSQLLLLIDVCSIVLFTLEFLHYLSIAGCYRIEAQHQRRYAAL